MDHPTVSSDEQLSVPEDNKPGHHPERDQDKPDPEDFVKRFEAAGHDDDNSMPSNTLTIAAVAVAAAALIAGVAFWWRAKNRRDS